MAANSGSVIRSDELNDMAAQPVPGGIYYIVNVNHKKFLDSHGGAVTVWNNGGRSVATVIAQNTSEHRNNLRWQILTCPHEANAYYLVQLGYKAFLDTHGRDVQIWNNGKQGTHDEITSAVIGENTSASARNLRWKLRSCPHESGSFYIINLGHAKFLDTHGKTTSVWNNGGTSEDHIVENNTSVHAGNIRWAFIDVREQDRFGDVLIGRFGMRGARPIGWVEYCGERSPEIPIEYKEIIAQCRQHVSSDGASLLRAYSRECPLYKEVNQALLYDDKAGLRKYGGFVRALRRAMLDRCSSGLNVQAGIVWRGMQLDDNSAYKVGERFLWPGFVSTSRKNPFPGNTIFRIDLAGQGLTFAVDISGDSEHPEEEEVLIYAYSGFEVTARESSGDNHTLISLQTCDTLLIDDTMGTASIGDMPSLSL